MRRDRVAAILPDGDSESDQVVAAGDSLSGPAAHWQAPPPESRVTDSDWHHESPPGGGTNSLALTRSDWHRRRFTNGSESESRAWVDDSDSAESHGGTTVSDSPGRGPAAAGGLGPADSAREPGPALATVPPGPACQ